MKMSRKIKQKSKTIRFPNDVLQQTQRVCAQNGWSFSAFVKQAVESALADLRKEKKP